MTSTLTRTPSMVTSCVDFDVEGDPHIVHMRVDYDPDDRDVTLYAGPRFKTEIDEIFKADEVRENLRAAMDRFEGVGFRIKSSSHNYFCVRYQDLQRALETLECDADSIRLVIDALPKPRHPAPAAGL